MARAVSDFYCAATCDVCGREDVFCWDLYGDTVCNDCANELIPDSDYDYLEDDEFMRRPRWDDWD